MKIKSTKDIFLSGLIMSIVATMLQIPFFPWLKDLKSIFSNMIVLYVLWVVIMKAILTIKNK